MRTRVIALLTAALLVMSAAPASAAEDASVATDEGNAAAASVEGYGEVYSSFNGPAVGGGGGKEGSVSPLASGTWQYDIYVNFRNINVYIWKYQHRIVWTGTTQPRSRSREAGNVWHTRRDLNSQPSDP